MSFLIMTDKVLVEAKGLSEVKISTMWRYTTTIVTITK